MAVLPVNLASAANPLLAALFASSPMAGVASEAAGLAGGMTGNATFASLLDSMIAVGQGEQEGEDLDRVLRTLGLQGKDDGDSRGGATSAGVEPDLAALGLILPQGFDLGRFQADVKAALANAGDAVVSGGVTASQELAGVYGSIVGALRQQGVEVTVDMFGRSAKAADGALIDTLAGRFADWSAEQAGIGQQPWPGESVVQSSAGFPQGPGATSLFYSMLDQAAKLAAPEVHGGVDLAGQNVAEVLGVADARPLVEAQSAIHAVGAMNQERTSAVSAAGAAANLQNAHIDAPVASSEWETAIGRQVVWQATQGNQTAEVTVNPPQLGPITIQVTLGTDNQASIQFVSAHAPVREAIQNALPRLDEFLSASGIGLGQVSVGAEHPQGQAGQHAPWEARQASSSGDLAQQTELPIQPAAVSQSRRLSAIDFFA